MGNRTIKRYVLQVAAFLLICLGVLSIYVVYLQSVAADGLAKNPLNQRSAQAEADVQRGSILDSEGRALAQSTQPGNRSYPMGESMAFVTGYFSEEIGSSGIEGYANRDLLGITEEVMRMGPIAQLFQSSRGNDVRLTIDSDAQQAAFDGLAGRRGAVVVLDVDTGAVLALVSSPSYDPNYIAGDWNAMLEREDSPLLNRALQGLYPPGSTIKPMIADIALEQGITDDHEVFECTGSLDVGGGSSIRESHGEVHGDVHLEQALVKSCNVTFGTLAMRMGAKPLKEGFRRFGFEKLTDGELQESASHLPDFSSLDMGDIAQVGIGQSMLLVTPMRMALLAAAMANDGVVMKPYMIQQVVSPTGVIVKEHTPTKWFSATTRSRANLMNEWMEEVVQKGTGTAAKVSGVKVTGKTGTAENPGGDDHAWFIGSAVIGSHRIAFSIIVENSGGGGTEAAPIARKIVLSLDK